MRDQELILRFLALLHEASGYQTPMVAFLNSYMGRHKNLNGESASALGDSFRSAIDIIYHSVGSRAFHPVRALNAAVFDSVMVGAARRLESGPVLDTRAFADAYRILLGNQSFLDACGRGTAGTERVRRRLDLATAAFAPVL
jgi:hypothetical protein